MNIFQNNFKKYARQLTKPFAPKQKGVPQLLNKTLLDMTRSMLAKIIFFIYFEVDKLLITANILNKV